MSARRCTRQNKPRWIERVISCVISKPTQRATSIFDRRGRRRLTCGTIFNVDCRPTELQVWQQVQDVSFFLSVNPTTTVKENQRRLRAASILWKIQIEFKFEVTCF